MSTQTQDHDSLINGGSWDDSVYKLNHLIDIIPVANFIQSFTDMIRLALSPPE